MVRHQRRSTKRTRLLIVIDPTVHTRAMENVSTVRHTPDFLLLFKFRETHGASLREDDDEVAEGGEWEEVADEHGGERGRRRRVRHCGDGEVGVEEVGEVEEVEEGEDERAEEG